MAKKIRIELDHAGIRQLLCSSEIAGEVEKAAEAIAARAGEGYEVVGPQALGYGGGRAGYGVKAVTYQARKDEAEWGRLSKAVR